MFPSLHATIRKVLESPADIVVQFVLEPLAFKDILSDLKSLGTQYAHQLSYLTRTFAFNMHREYQRLIKSTNDPTQYQVGNQPHTNPLSLSVPRCEGASLTVTCDQDNTAQPGVAEQCQDKPPLHQPALVRHCRSYASKSCSIYQLITPHIVIPLVTIYQAYLVLAVCCPPDQAL